MLSPFGHPIRGRVLGFTSIACPPTKLPAAASLGVGNNTVTSLLPMFPSHSDSPMGVVLATHGTDVRFTVSTEAGTGQAVEDFVMRLRAAFQEILGLFQGTDGP